MAPWQVTKNDLRRALDTAGGIATDAAGRFAEDNCLRMAASLSYTSLLAVVPLTAIAFAMLAAFPVFEGVRESFQSVMFSNFLPDAAENMREYLDQFVKNTATLSAVGIVGLALTAILLLSTIESALNTIFRVAKPRKIGPRLLVFWTVITLGPLLLGASFSLSTYFFAATEWLGVDLAGGVAGSVTRALPTLIMMVLLALFYVTIPNRPVSLRAAIVGAVFAGLLIAVLRQVFGLYVSSFPSYQNIYGALSALPIFLIWMYLSWTVVLTGAVITATIGEWRASGGRRPISQLRPGSKLTGALSVLAMLTARRAHGGGMPYRELLRKVGMTDHVLETLLQTLRDAHYVERTARNHWLLSRDLSQVTLFDLYRTLSLGIDETDMTLGDDGWQQRLKDRMGALKDRNQHAMEVSVSALLTDDATSDGEGAGNPPVALEIHRAGAND